MSILNKRAVAGLMIVSAFTFATGCRSAGGGGG